jgi:hypothetical protein
MREYDDHVRPYTPVLRRIIIMVVVLTAVPVMLWTITAFVRTYVAQPKLPTFRPLAATIEAPDSANAATDAEQAKFTDASHPIVEARATATDARSSPVIAIKKPSADRSPDADANAPAGGPQVAAATAAQPATAAMPSAAAVAQPIAPALFAAPATTGRTVWPNPPGFGPGNRASVQSPAANDDAVDALPPARPIAGRIPLPPHRPHLFAMVQTAVPVPKPRPAAAPEAAPVETEAEGGRMLVSSL